jgi:hypothetical protein
LLTINLETHSFIHIKQCAQRDAFNVSLRALELAYCIFRATGGTEEAVPRTQ